MRILLKDETKAVNGANVAVTVQPGNTYIELFEQSDTYSITFVKSVGFFSCDCGTLTVQGNGTYSWGTNFWGTPNPDYLPTQISTENNAVTFTITN